MVKNTMRARVKRGMRVYYGDIRYKEGQVFMIYERKLPPSPEYPNGRLLTCEDQFSTLSMDRINTHDHEIEYAPEKKQPLSLREIQDKTRGDAPAANPMLVEVLNGNVDSVVTFLESAPCSLEDLKSLGALERKDDGTGTKIPRIGVLKAISAKIEAISTSAPGAADGKTPDAEGVDTPQDNPPESDAAASEG